MVRFAELIVILELHQQGMTVSAIARRTGLHRKHRRKIPRPRPRAAGLWPAVAAADQVDERSSAICANGSPRFPELTGRRLHREIRELGYTGGYTAVNDFLREIRPRPTAGFELRFETPPGRQAQVDFAHFRTVFTDEPGVERIVWLFSLVLGHSRMLWGRFVLHQDMQTVLRCHAAAFAALGGVPAEILYDRMKTAVIPATTPRPATSSTIATLLDFAAHYGYLPKACRPYRAKTKGKVERPFRYVREDFFLGGQLPQPRRSEHAVPASGWIEVANARTHATTRRVVAEHFAEEHPHLLPLPAGPFQAVLRLERRITRDGMISVRRQSLQRAQRHPPPPGRGAQHRHRGAHPRRRPGDRRPSGAGGPRPAPHRSPGIAACRRRPTATRRARLPLPRSAPAKPSRRVRWRSMTPSANASPPTGPQP